MILTGVTFAGMIYGGAALCRAESSLPGIFLIIFGVIFAISWVCLAIHYAIAYCKHHALEAHVRQNPSEAYRMVLSGRVVAWYTRSKIRPVLDEHQLAPQRKRLRA